MKLRVIESSWMPFVDALCTRHDVETAGVVLAERLGSDVLFARRLIPLADEGYAIRRADQLRIDPLALNRLVRPARDNGLSVITVHTHPGASRPWFSAADDAGDSRLMPSLFAQMDGPHGSIVIAGDSRLPAARIWHGSHGPTVIGVSIVGRMLLSPVVQDGNGDNSPWFDRQRLALGATGQAVLRNMHIAVVGLGGTGSVVFLQLAHLGVGRLTIVDGDRVEASNISRILGATSGDVGRAWKVDVAARYADRLGLGTRVNVLRGHLGTDVSLADVEGSDVIISCVDTHLPRAQLNRLAYEKAIPLVDMGSAFRADSTGSVVAGAGRVVIVGPGRRCLACWGHIDPNRMRMESLSAADRTRDAADGYIVGTDVPQPSVVAFNTMIAGAAIIELLRLVTQFAGADDPPDRLNFDFRTGTVRRNRLHADASCAICLPEGSSTRQTGKEACSSETFNYAR
jgi:hypothetical protein